MTLPPFSDRIFYLERTDTLAHLGYMTSSMWALFLLDDRGEWELEGIAPSYDELVHKIWPANPTLLLEEPW